MESSANSLSQYLIMKTLYSYINRQIYGMPFGSIQVEFESLPVTSLLRWSALKASGDYSPKYLFNYLEGLSPTQQIIV